MVAVPYGIKFMESRFCSALTPRVKKMSYVTWTYILTFLVYTTFHLSRKPISVVKNVLNENCSKLTPPSPTNNSHWCDWKPFDSEDSSTLLGTLDSAYLFTYAFGMFFSGMIAERSKLNVFLCFGMVTSGILTALFGFGYTFNIHSYWYYLIVQMLCGFVQSTGWPGVVTVMGNWVGHKKKGLIMGIWNSHTSLGNILGTLIATAFLTSGWDLSFIVPGCIIAGMGIVVYFFLIPKPCLVGIPDDDFIDERSASCFVQTDEAEHLLPSDPNSLRARRVDTDYKIPVDRVGNCEEVPISFIGALRIPGVMEFAMSLFFSKLVSYTFLYWLPHFIFDSTNSDANESGKISTFFDIGGIAGGIWAGVISDFSGMPASTCSVMLVAAMPMIYGYEILSKTMSTYGNILLLLPVGFLVNGPYALITTAVSAELGTHSSLQGNAKALSTVTSIIDGTGSLGAAIGPFIAGLLSNSGNWNNVFLMLIAADIFSLLFLLRLVKKETQLCFRRCRHYPYFTSR